MRLIKKFIKNLWFDTIGLTPTTAARDLLQDDQWHSWGIDKSALSDNPTAIIAGLSDAISFEEKLLKLTDINIIALDPTPATAQFAQSLADNYPERFRFFINALGTADGEKDFFASKNSQGETDYIYATPDAGDCLEKYAVSVRSVESLMKQHNIDVLDLLKIDIEGEEYAVLEDLMRNNVKINQIAVEYHYRFYKNGIRKTLDTHQMLLGNGYRIALRTPWCEEFLYIREPPAH